MFGGSLNGFHLRSTVDLDPGVEVDVGTRSQDESLGGNENLLIVLRSPDPDSENWNQIEVVCKWFKWVS